MPDARRRHARHRRKRAAHCGQLARASTDVGPAGTIGPAHERAGSNTSAVILASISVRSRRASYCVKSMLRYIVSAVMNVLLRAIAFRGSAVEGNEAAPLALTAAGSPAAPWLTAARRS